MDLWRRYKATPTEELRNQLIEHYIPTVHRLAKSRSPTQPHRNCRPTGTRHLWAIALQCEYLPLFQTHQVVKREKSRVTFRDWILRR